MDAKEYLRRQIARGRGVLDAALKDLTEEQFNWTPPGTANPIAATLFHLVGAEDRYAQFALGGKPMIWETGGWSEKTGLKTLPVAGASWEEVKGTKFKLEPILAYQQAVRAATDAYVAGMSAEEFDRQVTWAGNQVPAADVIALITVNTTLHAGEIAALKGVQGAKGLPF